VDEEHLDVEPADTVKCLCQVNFKDNGFMVPGPNGVEGFLSRTDGFMYLTVLKEDKLLRDRIGRRQFAMILEMILYSTLHREMGR